MVFWKVLGAKVDAEKKMKRHMVLWVGSGWEGCFTKQRETPRGFLGSFLGGKVFTKKLETPHDFLRKVWVWRLHDSPKKMWDATLFAGKVLRVKVASQKNLTMVFWEGSGVRSSTQKKLKPHGFLGRFWVRRSTHKKTTRRRISRKPKVTC